jgi:hypothetical protein
MYVYIYVIYIIDVICPPLYAEMVHVTPLKQVYIYMYMFLCIYVYIDTY